MNTFRHFNILAGSPFVVCSRSFVFVVGRYNYYSVLSVMNTKVATPNLYTFLSRLFSLNSTTSHPFLHDCPLIVLKNVPDNLKLDKHNKSLKRLVSCASSQSITVFLIIMSYSCAHAHHLSMTPLFK